MAGAVLQKVGNGDAGCRTEAAPQHRAGGVSIGVAIIALLTAPLFVPSAQGQGLSPDEVLNRLTAREIAATLINYTAFNSDPGIGGATLRVNMEEGQPERRYSRSSLRVNRDFWLRNRNLAIYGDLGFSSLHVDDDYFALNELGDFVLFDGDRNLFSGRMGIGVATMIAKHVKIRPYVSVAYTRIESKTNTTGELDFDVLPPTVALILLDWKTDVWTIAGTLNAKYDRFWGEKEQRFEAQLDYTFAYHESFREDLNILTFSGVTDTINLLLRYSRPLVRIWRQPFRWNVLMETTALPTVDKDDLGFKFYFTFGGGIDWVADWRAYGRLLVRYVGLRFNGIVGDDVKGLGIGVSIRN